MTAIPAPARRITPLGGLRNTFTLTWRSVIKLRTNAEDLLGLSLQPIMYLVLFTYVFGGAIAGGTHAYLQYALPGLLVMTVVFATLGTGLMLNQDITGGVFDRFRTLPIARWAPLGGAVLGDMVRYMISVAITLAPRPRARSATPRPQWPKPPTTTFLPAIRIDVARSTPSRDDWPVP